MTSRVTGYPVLLQCRGMHSMPYIYYIYWESWFQI